MNRYWQGQVYKVPGDEIYRNKLRAALVWMDDYAPLVQKLFPVQPASNPIGSLADRKALRARVGVHDFAWYLREVYPELLVPTEYSDGYAHFGAFRSAKGCVDTLGADPTRGPGIYPCHNQHGTQLFLLAKNGRLISGQTLGTPTMTCVTVDAKRMELTKVSCATSGTHATRSRTNIHRQDLVTYGEWTYTSDRTLRHKSGVCVIAITSTVLGVGDCGTASLDERTWYADP